MCTSSIFHESFVSLRSSDLFSAGGNFFGFHDSRSSRQWHGPLAQVRLSAEEQERVERLFCSIDEDGSGSLERAEVAQVRMCVRMRMRCARMMRKRARGASPSPLRRRRHSAARRGRRCRSWR